VMMGRRSGAFTQKAIQFLASPLFLQTNKISYMRKLLMVPALVASLAAWSQKAVKPETFANSITSDDLKKHLYIIASKEMEGRETATEGQRKASMYIENQFKSLGLLPGNHGQYQLAYPVFQDSLVKAGLMINGRSFLVDKDFAVNMGTAYTA